MDQLHILDPMKMERVDRNPSYSGSRIKKFSPYPVAGETSYCKIKGFLGILRNLKLHFNFYILSAKARASHLNFKRQRKPRSNQTENESANQWDFDSVVIL